MHGYHILATRIKKELVQMATHGSLSAFDSIVCLWSVSIQTNSKPVEKDKLDTTSFDDIVKKETKWLHCLNTWQWLEVRQPDAVSSARGPA